MRKTKCEIMLAKKRFSGSANSNPDLIIIVVVDIVLLVNFSRRESLGFVSGLQDSKIQRPSNAFGWITFCERLYLLSYCKL